MPFFTVTPTGYQLGVPGLQETGITQDHKTNSIAIVSQKENSKPNMFFKKVCGIYIHERHCYF